jgi:hypothetical protein
MPGVSLDSLRIVNSGVSSLRSRVCSGGSAKPRPPGAWLADAPCSPTRFAKSLL